MKLRPIFEVVRAGAVVVKVEVKPVMVPRRIEIVKLGMEIE